METIITYLFTTIFSIVFVITVEVFFRNILKKRIFNVNVSYIMDLAKYSLILLLILIFIYNIFLK